MKQTIEEEKIYSFKVVCDDSKEQAIRALLIQSINKQGITVTQIDSIDIDASKTKIRIEMKSKDRQSVEKIVNRFSMEPDVFSVSFKTISEDIENALEIDEV